MGFYIFNSILLFVVCTGVSAQTYTLRGTVQDIQGKPAEHGNVILVTQQDSVFAGQTELQRGVFIFSSVKPGNYIIHVSAIGYEDSSCTVAVPIENIIVTLRPTILQGVQVTGIRKIFSYKNGNIRANIENTALASIPDVIEILSRLPTVVVSADRENISIIGKGTPLIYLDNQRIGLNDLATISSSDIKSIEIINNPSSKYEAEGRAVILITRKQNTKDGQKIDISETASVKRFFENRSSINASVRKHKTEIRCNAQYNYINRWEGLYGKVQTDSGSYQTYNGTSIGPRKQYMAGFGVYRQMRKDDYFSMNISGRIQEEPYTLNNDTRLNNAGNETRVETHSTNISRRPYLNTNINYFKALAPINSTLFLGAQYSHYERNTENRIYNNYNQTQLLLNEERLQEFFVDVGVVRLNFEKNFKTFKWENGAVFNFARSQTNFNIIYSLGSNTSSTRYEYLENNQAAFSQISGKIKKAEYNAGLRFENTFLRGGYKDSSNLLIDKTFAYLFPRLNISVPVDSIRTLTLNYARTVQRPDYANANQVTNYISPYMERSNNINLRPAVTDEVSVNLQQRSISLSANVYQHVNPSWYITEKDSVLQKIRIINQNLRVQKGMHISLTLPFEYKILSSNNMFTFNISKYSDPKAANFNTKPSWYFYSSNQVKLPGNYTLTASGWLHTRQYLGIFERNGQFSVDLSVSKRFHKHWTVTLNAFDIFRSLNFTEKFNVNGIYSYTIYYENVRELSVNIRYSIGKIKDSRFRNRDVNDSGNRLN